MSICGRIPTSEHNHIWRTVDVMICFSRSHHVVVRVRMEAVRGCVLGRYQSGHVTTANSATFDYYTD
jgi:hypothetical protein